MQLQHYIPGKSDMVYNFHSCSEIASWLNI